MQGDRRLKSLGPGADERTQRVGRRTAQHPPSGHISGSVPAHEDSHGVALPAGESQRWPGSGLTRPREAVNAIGTDGCDEAAVEDLAAVREILGELWGVAPRHEHVVAWKKLHAALDTCDQRRRVVID